MENLPNSIPSSPSSLFDFDGPVEGVGALDAWSGRGRECFREHLLTLSLRRKVRHKNRKI